MPYLQKFFFPCQFFALACNSKLFFFGCYNVTKTVYAHLIGGHHPHTRSENSVNYLHLVKHHHVKITLYRQNHQRTIIISIHINRQPPLYWNLRHYFNRFGHSKSQILSNIPDNKSLSLRSPRTESWDCTSRLKSSRRFTDQPSQPFPPPLARLVRLGVISNQKKWKRVGLCRHFR